jgi:LPXTG-motif cell wall-anchored protein
MQVGLCAQIDQKKIDSLAKAIDSSAKALKVSQDSFTKKQDSIYRSSVKVSLEMNGRKLDDFLNEQKRRESKERQQTYILALAGVLLFIVLIIGFLRKKKPKA